MPDSCVDLSPVTISADGTIRVMVPEGLQRLVLVIKANEGKSFHLMLEDGQCDLADIRGYLYNIGLVAVLSKSYRSFQSIVKFFAGQIDDSLPTAALCGWLLLSEFHALDIAYDFGTRFQGESDELAVVLNRVVAKLEETGDEAVEASLADKLRRLDFNLAMPCCGEEMVESAIKAGAIREFFDPLYI